WFVFSSKRRHTRSKRDWSSDVCSSDLFVRFDNGIKTMFHSAILKHCLDTIIVSDKLPESVADTTKSIMRKEEDIIPFIEKIRRSIQKPVYITYDHLLELYTIENALRGRSANIVRGKTTFVNGLEKLESVYTPESATSRINCIDVH